MVPGLWWAIGCSLLKLLRDQFYFNSELFWPMPSPAVELPYKDSYQYSTIGDPDSKE